MMKGLVMELWRLSVERLVALAVVAVNVVLAMMFAVVSQNRGTVAGLTVLLSLPGLAMIWFREGLSVTGFDRGVLRQSPPLMIDVIGWVFLVGLPAIYLYGFLP